MATRSKHEQRLAMIELYRSETGKTEMDMHALAAFALRKGWRLPPPKEPVDLIARTTPSRLAKETRN